MPGFAEQQPYYIAKVIDIDDPEHRRRLRARGPRETEIDVPEDCLAWLPAFQLNSDTFSLPNVGEPVAVFKFGNLLMWTELPDKSSWQGFNDDYATAWMQKHKDVMLATYKQSEGWYKKQLGNIKIETDNAIITIQGKNIELSVGNVNITTDGTAVSIKADKVEISTDGSKVTVKNDGVSLADVLDKLEVALAKHTHPTPAGPSNVPININAFTETRSQFKQLLK
jgi:hypothetical protein